MANQEHLEILKKGVKVWNQWRKDNPEIKPDLVGADLIGVNLVEENKTEDNITSLNSELIFHEQKIREIYFKSSISGIRDINFSSSNLRGFNFREANLFGVNLFGANLEGTNLQEADIRYADLRETNFLGANLLGANLSYAKLFGANLGQTTLTSVDFTGADLRSCILWSANAIYANFHKAIITGSCIQDWNINNFTNLEEVICDYIYLMLPEQERRPFDTTKMFDIGDFELLIKKTRETVDLIFNEDVKEIQNLIDKLSSSSPPTNTAQQMQIATEVITIIENNLDWKQRAIAAAQQGLLEMIKNHPIGAFVAGAIEGWRLK